MVSCPGNWLSTESDAAPRPLGATTANTGLYLREEQRRGRDAATPVGRPLECQRIFGTGHPAQCSEAGCRGGDLLADLAG